MSGRNGVKDMAQVADSCEKLYSELPSKILCLDEKKKDLKEFLRENLPQSERKEIDDEFKKTLVFRRSQQKAKKSRKRQRKGQYLTSHERRTLGLNKLPKKGLRFSDFHQMHGLWKEYMRKVIGFSADERKVAEARSESSVMTLGDEQLQMRVCRADYHGAFVKVVRALNPKLIGIQGYVVMETRNTFQFVAKDSSLKIVPKSGSAFSFAVDDFVFTVEGSNMCVKPSERAVKKWKNKPPLEIQP